MSAQSVLVTGANGFLGREIVSQLSASGITVRATDLDANGAVSGIYYQKADVTQAGGLSRMIDGVAVVIHAAGLAHVFSPHIGTAENYRHINEIGTLNMASAAAEKGVEHFILISSVSVYGPFTKGIYGENSPLNPVGSYALSKLNAERRAREVAEKSGMSLTILRLSTLYGEGDPGNIGRLMHRLDRGTFFWIGNGSNRKSLLYKSDAARACLAVVSRRATGLSIYNVSGPACTMRDIVDDLMTALGKRPLIIRIPAPIAMRASKFLSRLGNDRLCRLHATMEKWLAEDAYDTSCIEGDYGFHAQVELFEGLRREVCWYRQSKGTP
jgi:nucleoside-diphosphate-sugar epimerase